MLEACLLTRVGALSGVAIHGAYALLFSTDFATRSDQRFAQDRCGLWLGVRSPGRAPAVD